MARLRRLSVLAEGSLPTDQCGAVCQDVAGCPPERMLSAAWSACTRWSGEVNPKP